MLPGPIMRLLAAVVLFAVVAAQAQPPEPPPPAASGVPPAQLLPMLIEHSRRPATLQGGRLAGPGAELLRSLASTSQFVLMGELHGNQGVADFATALWAELQPFGFRHAAVEIDPWAAAALARELPAGTDAWSAFLAERGGVAAMAFYTWAPEARFAASVLRSGRAPALWGLDQVFIGSAAWHLGDIAQGARSAAARRLAAELAADAKGRLSWLGEVDTSRLQRLRDSLSDPADERWRTLLDAMIDSATIYAPFSGRGGEATLANLRREAGMRRLFLEQYRQAEGRGEPAPKVMFKMGGNHMFRGASTTLVQALGGFVSEFAAARGSEALSLLVLCGPGSHAGGLDGSSVPCGDLADDDDWRFIAPYVSAEALTVFDLRAWRLRPRRLAHLSTEVQRIAGSFDLLVFVPGAPASAFLPGLKPLPR